MRSMVGGVSGLVLCGGASARMGRDKARLELGARSLLARALDALRPWCDELRLACGATARYGELGLALDLDRAPGLGPLAGLEAGLAAARHERVLAVAVDMPWLAEAPLGELLLELERTGADACLVDGPRGLEPLCGAWSRRALPAVRAALDAGARRVLAPFESAFREEGGGRGPQGPPAALARLAWSGRDRERALANLNTPEELERARLVAGAGARA